MKLIAQRTRKLFYGGDNLAVMRGLDSGIANLIYLDPPFNSKSLYKGAMGTAAEKHQFKDTWKMTDINADELNDLKNCAPDIHSLISLLGGIHGESWHAYLTFMGIRLLEMRRLLKDTGSIYLHCDPTMSHPLKLIMDCVFGANNFRNEIVWAYTGPSSPGIRQFPRKHDSVFWYSKTNEWTFNREDMRVPYKDPKQTLRRAFDAGRGIGKSEIEKYRARGKVIENWWTDIALAVRSPNERTSWATQKPLALLERIVKASSNEGDLVLDPFCGCATACFAAENLNRAWIGIDKDKESAEIFRLRAKGKPGILIAGEIIDASRTECLPVRAEMQSRLISKRHWNQVKAELYEKQGGKCAAAPFCKNEVPVEIMEMDRIKSGARGGRYVRDNVQLLCPRCNRVKGAGTMAALRRKLAQGKLYDEL